MTEPAQAIVVLGARVHPGGVPSGALRARLVRGVELFREGAAPLLVFSGGVGAHPPAEARVMLALAQELGVPTDACVLEERSRTTHENAVFTAALLRARGITDVIVVTDPYHLYRARQHFRLQGFEVRTEAALLDARHATALDRAKWTLREVAAIARRPRLLFARAPKRRS